MSRPSKTRDYRVIGAFDTETSNIDVPIKTAYFALYQLLTLDVPLEMVNGANVREVSNVSMFRHHEELYSAFDGILEDEHEYIPVIAVHNLSFDMHAISSWLMEKQDAGYVVEVLAKTPQKPIKFTLKRDKRPCLVIWDTLGFSGESLEKMGIECGYEKSVGDWDYKRVRTPETELTEPEKRYASNDVYALVCWLSWWLTRNPQIRASDLGGRAATKTGVVRLKRERTFYKLKGFGMKRTCGDYWRIVSQSEALRDDDTLFTFHACTRGGFTFVSSEMAAVPIECADDERVYAFDATSQHPAQMVSHLYPYRFEEAGTDLLELDLQLVEQVTVDDVLDNFARPFPVAFDACVDVFGLRLKDGSVFSRDGISPLASARLRSWAVTDEKDEIREYLRSLDYSDMVEGNNVQMFGKLFSAEHVRLYVTELDWWIICQCFDYDYVVPVHGFDTMRFQRPTDYSVLSVMTYYGGKNAIKRVRREYEEGKKGSFPYLRGVLPDVTVAMMEDGKLAYDELEERYMAAKADLNALYGIEITDESKRDMLIDDDGIVYTGSPGADNLPSTCKAWYQFGQRVVGWSRVAQTLVMMLLGDAGRIVNGDTDSVKILAKIGDMRGRVRNLERYSRAVDEARSRVCARVMRQYPDKVHDLTGIGHYIEEDEYTRFYSAWNKSYIVDGYHMTIAGVPVTKRDENGSLEDWAREYAETHSWGQTCGQVLGYNTCIDASITKLNVRVLPKWASMFDGDVIDWRGDTAHVHEPRAIGLFPMAKVIGGYDNVENVANALVSERHNRDLRTDERVLTWRNGKAAIE